MRLAANLLTKLECARNNAKTLTNQVPILTTSQRRIRVQRPLIPVAAWRNLALGVVWVARMSSERVGPSSCHDSVPRLNVHKFMTALLVLPGTRAQERDRTPDKLWFAYIITLYACSHSNATHVIDGKLPQSSTRNKCVSSRGVHKDSRFALLRVERPE